MILNHNSACIIGALFCMRQTCPFSWGAAALARFWLGQAIALKPTNEAGRCGGDSIARRVHFFKKIIVFSRRGGVGFLKLIRGGVRDCAS